MKAKVEKKRKKTFTRACGQSCAWVWEAEIRLAAVGFVPATRLRGQRTAKALGISEQTGDLHFPCAPKESRSPSEDVSGGGVRSVRLARKHQSPFSRQPGHNVGRRR